MKIQQPPLYPEVRIIPSFISWWRWWNRRELQKAYNKACELDGKVWMPTGTWKV